MKHARPALIALLLVETALAAIASPPTRRTLGPGTPAISQSQAEPIIAPSPKSTAVAPAAIIPAAAVSERLSTRTPDAVASVEIPVQVMVAAKKVDATPVAPVTPAVSLPPSPVANPTEVAAPTETVVKPAASAPVVLVSPDAQVPKAVDAVALATPVIEEPQTPYMKEIARLQAIAPSPIPLRNVPLSTVIRAITQHAGMNYIAPNDGEFSDIVTLRYSGNPWQLLSILKRRHNFEMAYEDGLWTFYRQSPGLLISRTYQLRYNNQGEVKAGASGGLTSSRSSDNGSSNRNGSSGSNGSSSQASSGDRGNVFEPNNEKIVKDIKSLLGIPVTGLDAQISESGAVGEMPAISTKHAVAHEGKIEAGKADVIYMADSNQLFIIATRQQHQYVEDFLKAADKPQTLIRIDAKLVETTRDPRSFLGIDPSGWAKPTVGLKSASSSESSSSSSSSGGNLSTPTFDLGKLSTLRAPDTAILSASDISFQLNMLKQDSSSRITNEPRLVTTNNREVSIESVIEEPYASSTTNNAVQGTAGTSGQTQTQLERIKIGTVINVLPQIMRGENGQRYVNLNLVMTVSGKVGDKNIYGQLVPVTSSRSYRYNAQVPDGYTLAIGGLDATTVSDAENKVPFAGDIPVVGYLFKSKAVQDTRSNLIAYITPTILDFANGDGQKAAYAPIPEGVPATARPTPTTPPKPLAKQVR